MKFRKKPVVIDAEQWFEVEPFEEGKARVVGYFRHPDIPGESLCPVCGKTMHLHGYLETLEGGYRVCPGDWIIKGVAQEFYPCKDEIFAATYEADPAVPAGRAVQMGEEERAEVRRRFAPVIFQEGVIPEVGINGCFVEDLLQLSRDRLEHFQNGPFPCPENEVAIAGIVSAWNALERRRAKRERQGVEGVHQAHVS